MAEVGSILRRPELAGAGKAATADDVQEAWSELSPADRRRGPAAIARTIAETIAGGGPFRMQAGHSGFEAEFTFPLRIRGYDEITEANEAIFADGVLAWGPDHAFALTVDGKRYYQGMDGRYYRTQEAMRRAGMPLDASRIMGMPEFVSRGLLRVLDGEESQDGGRAWRAVRHLEQDLETLGRAPHQPGDPPSVPLARLLRPGDGWELTNLGRDTLVGPRPVGDWPGGHHHHSIGVPLTGWTSSLTTSPSTPDGTRHRSAHQGVVRRPR